MEFTNMQKLRTTAKVLLIVAAMSFFATEYASAQSLVGPAVRTEVKVLSPETTYKFSLGNPNLNPVITALAFSNDKNTFLVGGDNHMIYFGNANEGVDSRTGKAVERATFQRAQEFDALEDWVRAIAVNPAVPTEIAALSQNGQIVVKDLGTNSKRNIDSNLRGAHAMDYSPNGKVLAVCGFDSYVVFYDAVSLESLTKWKTPGESSTTLKFSPDGRLFALGGRDGVIRVWNTEDGKTLADFALTNAATQDNPNPTTQRARAVCFSPSGSLVAAAGDANQIMVWDLTTGKRAAALNVDGRKIYSLVFCDETTLAAGDSVNDVTVWNIPEQKMIAIGQGRKKGSKDNEASHSNESENAYTLGHTGTVSALIYDNARKTLFSGSFDTTVIKWQLP